MEYTRKGVNRVVITFTNLIIIKINDSISVDNKTIKVNIRIIVCR